MKTDLVERISEGKAKITISKGTFFNPKMKKLRDLSVLFLSSLNLGDALLLDSTCASGVRAIRYSKEAKIRRPVLLDINEVAAKDARINVSNSKIKAKVFNKSIQEFANTTEEKFSVIDLDPFGTPVPYIYDLLKVAKDSTIMMITATDTAVLCGAHMNACLKLYDSKPSHSVLCKEVGIRILINYIIRTAAKFNYGVEVMLSISDLHYMRVFLRLNSGAKRVHESIVQAGFGFYCNNCQNFGYFVGIIPKINIECEFCGKNLDSFGPLFLGKLYDKRIIEGMINMKGPYGEVNIQLGRLYEEFDSPLFYSVPKLTKYLKKPSISPKILGQALNKNGYHVSYTQFDSGGLKTNAGIRDMIGFIKTITGK